MAVGSPAAQAAAFRETLRAETLARAERAWVVAKALVMRVETISALLESDTTFGLLDDAVLWKTASNAACLLDGLEAVYQGEGCDDTQTGLKLPV